MIHVNCDGCYYRENNKCYHGEFNRDSNGVSDKPANHGCDHYIHKKLIMLRAFNHPSMRKEMFISLSPLQKCILAEYERQYKIEQDEIRSKNLP